MSAPRAAPLPALAWAEEALAELAGRGLRRALEPLGRLPHAHVRAGGRELVNLSSNDYLGLAGHPRVREAAARALAEHGWGSGASRLVTGDSEVHQRLEARLARFERAGSALLFNSGWAANTGLIPALVGKDDAVFSDALNHASLVDGCRLSRARVVVYPHADVAALARALRETPARRRLVVTDTVFSMDGDVAPLAALVEACEAAGAALVVDEAHATGVLGARGAGLCEQLGLEGRVDVRMGTLSKALGGLGAYVACAPPLRELLLHRARPFVFSTALPMAACAAAEAALDVLETEPALRERLWRHIRRLAEGLAALGLPARAESAVFPVVLGTPGRALAAAAALRERGLLVKAIRPPTVPEGTSRLRVCLSAAHTDEDVERTLAALADVLRR